MRLSTETPPQFFLVELIANTCQVQERNWTGDIWVWGLALGPPSGIEFLPETGYLARDR